MEATAGDGALENDIVGVVTFEQKTLRKQYPDELDSRQIKATRKVPATAPGRSPPPSSG